MEKHRKIYTKLPQAGSAFASTIQQANTASQNTKKISATQTPDKGLKHEYKKAFLPLLIEVYEMRQLLDNRKLNRSTSLNLFADARSPEQVLEKFLMLQKDVEETKRWCDGALKQIEKGIMEARSLVNEPAGNVASTKRSWIKRWIDWLWYE
ncbi:MAG: hypothetical protein A3F09_01795 [Chlamydiae bacterium RIFCSPHIGHO2_12_FULL_49_11]|nr:MAG: hypothetical protein A3F09_01795 [Chlamydiae bacterium RIFCSPHIGHO2_12_FULL_49_11]